LNCERLRATGFIRAEFVRVPVVLENVLHTFEVGIHDAPMLGRIGRRVCAPPYGASDQCATAAALILLSKKGIDESLFKIIELAEHRLATTKGTALLAIFFGAA
jgi:hypothetical protein